MSINNEAQIPAQTPTQATNQNTVIPTLVGHVPIVRSSAAAPSRERKRKATNESLKVSYGSRAGATNELPIPKSGRYVEVEWFEPDGSPGSETVVVETCMNLLKSEAQPLRVITFFGCALAAHYPYVKSKIKSCLNHCGVALNKISLPEEAIANAIDLDENEPLDVCDAHVIMAACVCLLFKNINDKSYAKYLSNRLRALGGILGMTNQRRGDQILPINLKQAEYVRGKLGAYHHLKREMLKYLMGLCDAEGLAGLSARYLCMILSWNEMTHFCFIHEKLCLTGSPVLQVMAIRADVVRFADAYLAVASSKYPQFFRYFCSGDQESLVQRNKFPILSAVAHALKNDELDSSTTRNFVGTLTEDEQIVADLVDMHKSFMENNTMGITRAVAVLTRDPIPAGYVEEDES